ncbi:hypothetical protein GRF29_103g1546143 [Pseudopithomyces chartarum]|uniref:Uncharacterized protein n=1 Tax=Pseudopithomyces chartarum TaxID=1892770 RepID=A0AAN6RFL6_9PLEO|nr:hypothetical protein GRF29_103g1546143 [Pseudopithomyces chartarum]
MPDKIAMSRADRASARASCKADQATQNISPVVQPDEATHMYAELRLFFAKNCHKFTDEVLKELHSILVALNQANHIPKSSLLYQIAGIPARHSYWAMGKQVIPHKSNKVHKVLGTQYMLLSKDDYFPTLAITAILSHLTCYLQFKEGKCSNCQVDAKGKRSDGTKPLYPQCAVAMSSFTHEPDDRIFRHMDESSSLRDMEPSSSSGSTKPAQKASNRHLKETKQKDLSPRDAKGRNLGSLAPPSSRKRNYDSAEQISLLNNDNSELVSDKKKVKLDTDVLGYPARRPTRSSTQHIDAPATPHANPASHSLTGWFIPRNTSSMSSSPSPVYKRS